MLKIFMSENGEWQTVRNKKQRAAIKKRAQMRVTKGADKVAQNRAEEAGRKAVAKAEREAAEEAEWRCEVEERRYAIVRNHMAEEDTIIVAGLTLIAAKAFFLDIVMSMREAELSPDLYHAHVEYGAHGEYVKIVDERMPTGFVRVRVPYDW